ncbi:hypothetical protein [Methylocystis hirsuta]|uniref:Uncharacterized protein n=1 Tax=Methylocystis hirsuta TaxID=369798 RepID=A0A3M9XPZ9_9HYPH|nr:hypothetical protein [Methylocystis hirsuta]RNJ49746.1 hypothetical protein D1O30_09200 [Methylocystis hirsuta]
MASRHCSLIAALGAAIFLGGATAEAQRRTPSEAGVSPTEHFGEKAPPKEEPAPQSTKPVSGEEDARPGVGEVSKEPQVPTKARSIRRDPAAQPTPKP